MLGWDKQRQTKMRQTKRTYEKSFPQHFFPALLVVAAVAAVVALLHVWFGFYPLASQHLIYFRNKNCVCRKERERGVSVLCVK